MPEQPESELGRLLLGTSTFLIFSVTVCLLLVESPVGNADRWGIVLPDRRDILDLKRVLVVSENDWNDMREHGSGHDRSRFSGVVVDRISLGLLGCVTDDHLAPGSVALARLEALQNPVQSSSERNARVYDEEEDGMRHEDGLEDERLL